MCSCLKLWKQAYYTTDWIVRQLSLEIKCHVQQFGQKRSDGIKSLSDL